MSTSVRGFTPVEPPVVRAETSVSAASSLWEGGRVSPRVRCVLADNPSPLTYLGTNTWILSEVEHAHCVVVDPGPDSDDHLEAVRAACREDGLVVEAVVITHDHPDHAESAARFAASVGASVLGRRFNTLPDGPVALSVDAPSLEVVSLPGHADDMVGLYYPADRSVVTGDMLFRQSSTLICWPHGSLAQYFDSLDRLQALVATRGVVRLLTAHGSVIEDPQDTINTVRIHRQARLARLVCAIEQEGTSDFDRLMEIVYPDVDAQLDLAVRLNIRSQLAYLEEMGMLPE